MIRALEISDQDAYLKLWLQALAECPAAFGDDTQAATSRTSKFWALQLDKSPIYGYFVDDILVGMVGVTTSMLVKKMHLASVGPLYVLPDRRKQGLATKLLEHAIAHLPPYVERLRIGVDASNMAVLRLYEEQGFKAWGTEKAALKLQSGLYVDVIWMDKQR